MDKYYKTFQDLRFKPQSIIKGDENDYDLCFDTPITDDVIGYCSEEDVSNIMKQIQDLPLYS